MSDERQDGMSDQQREELGRTQADVSALLDEVYALRLMLAYESEVLEATLDYKTFPKSRRSVQQNQVARMQLVATGRASAQAMVERSYPSGSLRGIRRQVGLVVAGNWRNGWGNITRDDEGDQNE